LRRLWLTRLCARPFLLWLLRSLLLLRHARRLRWLRRHEYLRGRRLLAEILKHVVVAALREEPAESVVDERAVLLQVGEHICDL
jgi:hypothetical protein